MDKPRSPGSPPGLNQIRSQLRALMPMLRTRYRVGELEIFGSFVREEAGQESDLDLLVTFEKPPTLLQFIDLENLLSDALGVKVDLVMKTALKPRIGERILSEAQPV
ncbi:MAG: nucleotidyltransferase family protein [Chloroflexi bacterium]|nr:nucleotidyltransferase family protein [Chloroflexota bacterium]